MSSPSMAANCPVTPMEARTCSACVTTSNPATRTLPGVRGSKVVRMLIVVVLPAPLAPSSAKTMPAGISRSTPRRTWLSLNDFCRPSIWIADCVCAGIEGFLSVAASEERPGRERPGLGARHQVT